MFRFVASTVTWLVGVMGAKTTMGVVLVPSSAMMVNVWVVGPPAPAQNWVVGLGVKVNVPVVSSMTMVLPSVVV